MTRAARGNEARAKVVERLMAAMDRCALARGEACWTQGYRAQVSKADVNEEARLYAKEQRQWNECARVEAAFKRLTQRFARALPPADGDTGDR